MASPIFSPRGNKSDIESGTSFQPRFDADGLIVAVITEADSGEVLMVGYMNDEALKRTIETGEAWYWSRSRQEYWKKGGTSGQVQKVQDILTDCDQDALVVKVKVEGNGATCHVGYQSCFYRSVEKTESGEFKLSKPTSDRVYDPETVYGN